jgi:putative membrane protein
MGFYDGYGMMSGLGLFGPIGMIVFWGVVAVLVFWAVRSTTRRGRPSGDALDILRNRFARGEIDRASFEEARKVLR